MDVHVNETRPHEPDERLEVPRGQTLTGERQNIVRFDGAGYRTAFTRTSRRIFAAAQKRNDATIVEIVAKMDMCRGGGSGEIRIGELIAQRLAIVD